MSAPVITPFVPPTLIPTIIVAPVITAIAAIPIPPPVIVASIIVVAIAPAIIVTAPVPLVVIAPVIVTACLAPLFAAVPTAAWRHLWARLAIPAAAPVVIIIALVIFAAPAARALACLRILSVGLTLPSRPAVFAAFAAFILGRILRRCGATGTVFHRMSCRSQRERGGKAGQQDYLHLKFPVRGGHMPSLNRAYCAGLLS